MKNYVYILVRKDLTNSQRVVQSSHVAWEVSKRHNLSIHPSMVLIGVKDLNKLNRELHSLENLGLEVVKFYEPLFNNELTAIGILTTTDEERKHFKKYQLLTDTSFYPEKLQQELDLKSCTHRKTKASYKETLAFEYYPRRTCQKCLKEVNIPLTDEEKISLLNDFFKDFELTLSPEEVQSKKNGFNL